MKCKHDRFALGNFIGIVFIDKYNSLVHLYRVKCLNCPKFGIGHEIKNPLIDIEFNQDGDENTYTRTTSEVIKQLFYGD